MRRKAIKKQRNNSKSVKLGRRKIKKRVAAPINEPLWSSELDAKGNFKNLNLTFDLNKIPKLSNKKIKEELVGEGTVEVDEEYTLDQIAKLNEGTFVDMKPKITQDDGFYVKNLYKKYGEDYSRMVLDHKVNKMMWNETQIKKKFDAYRKKFGPIEV